MSGYDLCAHVTTANGGAARFDGASDFFRGHLVEERHAASAASARPDGIYASWWWDGRRLTVVNDRYGVAPLFYWHDGTQCCVSPSILSLIERGAPTAIDDDALATFLRLGFFLDDDTPFAAIRAVPPGATLTWEDGAISLAASGLPIAARQAITRDEAIDGFIALCRDAIRRRPADPERTFMPLSGGRDSRHILFEVVAAGGRPHCITVPRLPPRPGEDERIAPLVASAAGVPHTLLTQNRHVVGAEIEKNWATHLCADEHAWYMPIVDAIGGHAAVMYDGLGGALSVPSRFHTVETMRLLEADRIEELAERLLRANSRIDEKCLSRLLRSEVNARLSWERAHARFTRELSRHVGQPDPLKSFNFWNRIRRELALTPYGLMKQVPTVYAPYLDHALYDFLMGLTPTVVSPNLVPSDKTFHTDVINRAFPEHAHVPFENKQAPKIDASAHYARNVADAATYLLRHQRHGGGLMNRGFVVSRALAALVSRSVRVARPWLAELGVYLMQLDMVSGRRLPAWTSR
jgi:hypothetical protein